MKVEHLSSAAAADRHRAWEAFVDQAFGAVDMNIDSAKTFKGEIRRASIGELELNEVVSDFEIAKRTSRHIARDGRDHHLLLLLRSGELNIEQAGHQCSLSPGMFGLVHLNTPYVYSHLCRTNVLSIKIPSDVLRTVLREPCRLGIATGVSQAGAARITADFLFSFAAALPDLPEQLAGRYAGRIVDLVGILLESSDGDPPMSERSARTTTYGRCMAFIEIHVDDPELCPERIAAAAGISVRYLHEVFRRGGETVGDFIRRCRLKRARDELTNPSRPDVLVKEIAFRTGFRSQAHFAREIRRSFGVTPTALRRMPQ